EVVPAGVEQGFLAPLPLACLAPPPEIASTLQRWGVHRLGDLARLPAAEVATRLGPAGAALVRAARGIDERPLAPEPLPAAVEEALALEYALENLEPLLFVLRGLGGPRRAGAPAVVASYRPGVACTVPFTPSPVATPERSPADGVCRLVVRALRPPRPVEVFSERGAPVFVRGDGLGGRVVGTAG